MGCCVFSTPCPLECTASSAGLGFHVDPHLRSQCSHHILLPLRRRLQKVLSTIGRSGPWSSSPCHMVQPWMAHTSSIRQLVGREEHERNSVAIEPSIKGNEEKEAIFTALCVDERADILKPYRQLAFRPEVKSTIARSMAAFHWLSTTTSRVDRRNPVIKRRTQQHGWEAGRITSPIAS
jgi:hypothetical protein